MNLSNDEYGPNISWNRQAEIEAFPPPYETRQLKRNIAIRRLPGYGAKKKKGIILAENGR